MQLNPWQWGHQITSPYIWLYAHEILPHYLHNQISEPLMLLASYKIHKILHFGLKVTVPHTDKEKGTMQIWLAQVHHYTLWRSTSRPTNGILVQNQPLRESVLQWMVSMFVPHWIWQLLQCFYIWVTNTYTCATSSWFWNC